MKRLATLALAVILITGCNAMKQDMEYAELLSKETEKQIQAQAWPTETPITTEPTPTHPPTTVQEREDESSPETPVPSAEPTAKAQAVEPEPLPAVSDDENTGESGKTPLQPAESAEIIECPYITCPPEPEWPYITAPEPPTYTPEPEIIEPPQAEPSPTPQPTPAVPADPVDPVPEPTEQPVSPTLQPTAEATHTGYVECSCGAKLTPEELVPHMKAHAMNGENHSYRAY